MIVEITAEAEADLEAIGDYIARDNPARAVSFVRELGRICMDQLMIRLPHEYPVGTAVTLIGEDHGKTISLQDIADYCDTIHYEIACGFTQRLKRTYVN